MAIQKKTSLAAQLARDVAVEVDALLGCGASDGIDFEAIETAARRQVLGLAARAIEQRLNADASDHAGPTLRCGCGQDARYAGRRSKVFQSILGELKLDRAYYHCPQCKGGFCPRDRYLGMDKTCFSPATVRMIGTVGSMVSFQEGSQLLRELAGIGVDASQVERGAEALGGEIAADERLRAEPLGKEPLPSTLYLGLDGTGIPMRAAELAGRPGKQPDGSAKTREAKISALWSAEARDSEGCRCATRVPFLIRRLSRAPPRRTPPKIDPLSPNACCARRASGASVKSREWPWWPTERPGFGI